MSATVGVEGVAAPAIVGRAAWIWSARPIARFLTRLFCVLVLFVAAGAAGLALYAAAHGGTVYQGVRAGSVNLGGLTPAEAERALDQAFTAWATMPLRLTGPDAAFDVAPAKAGVSLDAAATVEQAMAWGRDGSLWDRSRAWARGLVRGVSVPLVVELDPAKGEAALRRIAPDVVRAPVDAAVRIGPDGRAELVPDRPGRALDAAATLSALAERGTRLSSEPVAIATTGTAAAVPAATLAPALPTLDAALDAPLLLTAGDARWHVPIADLGRILGVAADGSPTVDRVAIAGVVAALAVEIHRPVLEANVIVGEDGRLDAVPAQTGVDVDREASVAAIAEALLAGRDEVALVVSRTPPLVTDAMAEAAAARADRWLDAGIALRWNGGRASLSRADLLAALTIRVKPGAAEPFAFGLDREIVRGRLEEIAAGFDQPVADARFRLVDGAIVAVADGRPGRELDVAGGLDRVLAVWRSPAPAIELPVKTVQPTWTKADLPTIELGDDILAEGGTFYGSSSGPRRQNVELAASLENGWLVPPDGVFSFAQNAGQVTEAAGFVTGYGIIEQGGAFITAPMVGGGICQVSTTIFQAAFWAGLPVEERYQHPYYIRSYGEAISGLPGLDAMVNIEPDWALDLKFRNTTGNWIAVVAIADGENLWTRIVGTDPGWEVEASEPAIANRVSPDPAMYFEDSPELPLGQTLVVETASEGFDVAITRTVRKGGKVIDTYTVSSTFSPARNLTLRGTGPAEMPSPFS